MKHLSRTAGFALSAVFAIGTAMYPTAASAAPGQAATNDGIPLAMRAAIPYAPCVSGGPTANDRAIANRLRGAMNGPRLRGALDDYRVSCARIIAEATKGRGLNKRAALIAITTAITETSLHNYTLEVDHDSLGLFQQRASWGSAENRTNPVAATNAFLAAMQRKYPNDGWQSGSVGAICQRVQVSAFPDRYNQDVHDAQLLVNEVWPTEAPPPAPVVWPRSGGPAVYNPQNQNLETYFRSATDQLEERYWDNGSWLGGPVTGAPPITDGKPISVYNPVSKNISVFYNSRGNLAEMYYDNTKRTWANGVLTANQQMTGSPAVVFNPGENAMEVYYNSGGRLVETYWSGGVWRSQQIAGAALVGSPSVLHNDRNRNIEVFYNRPDGNGGHFLAEHYWNATTRTWSGGSLNAPMDATASPSAIWDPTFSNTEVYYRWNGNLHQKFWQSSDGSWSKPGQLPGRITEGDPYAVFNPANGNAEVYYNTDGKVAETYHTELGWSSGGYPGGAAAAEKLIGTPFAVHNGRNRNLEVYFSNNGTLAEYYHDGKAWSSLVTIGGKLH